MRIRLRSLGVIVLCLLLIVTSCSTTTQSIPETTTETEIETTEEIQEEPKDRFYYATKDELFQHYFAEFYNYIIKVRNGKEDLESYGITNLDIFYGFSKTYEGGQGDFPSVGRLLGKYFLKADLGGSIYNQKPEDGFVGYCLEHDMYTNATIFFREIFRHFRKEEGCDLKYEHATDFLALPNDSMIDTVKYFFYSSHTLPKYFTQSTVTYKLIDSVPDEELVELLTSRKPVPINKSDIHPNDDDCFGQKSDTTAIFQVRVAKDDVDRYKKLALTFDSGVTIDKTISLLDVLDAYDIKATFFLTLGAIKDSPELVQEMVKRGHEIANHSTTHSDFRKMTDLSKKLEIYFTHKYVKELTGIDMHLFRFPYGSYDNKSIRIVKEMGYYPIQWSNDSLDWKNQGVEQIIAHVYDGVQPHSGTIILFHNGADYTVQALPFVIEKLKQDGFSFAKVTDLIYLNGFDVKTNMGQQQKRGEVEHAK